MNTSLMNHCSYGQPNVCRVVYCAFLTATLLSCTSFAFAGIDSLCSPEEKILFTCTIGKKLVSVCSSKDLSQTSGYVQYRFGARDHALDLVYPSEKIPPASKFSYGESGGAKSSLENLFFSISGYTYTIYRETAAFDSNGSGIRVKAPDGVSTRLKCKEDDPPSNLYDLNTLGLRMLPGESLITSEYYEEWPAESPNADLLYGVLTHDFALVNMALEKGADVNFHAGYGFSVLGAVTNGRSESIRLNRVDKFDEETDRLIALLLAKGALPTISNPNGATAIIPLISSGAIRSARSLLDVGWPNDYNYRMYIGTLLSDTKLVKESLDHGIDPNQPINGARHLAIAIGPAKQLDKLKREQALVILELLLKAGARIDEGKPHEGGGDIVRAYSGRGEEEKPALELLIRYATPAARSNTLWWAKIWNKEPYLHQQPNLGWFIQQLEQQ